MKPDPELETTINWLRYQERQSRDGTGAGAALAKEKGQLATWLEELQNCRDELHQTRNDLTASETNQVVLRQLWKAWFEEALALYEGPDTPPEREVPVWIEALRQLKKLVEA